METKIIYIFTNLVSRFQDIKKFGFTISILLNLLGFFLGNIAATSFNLFFGGLGALLVLFSIEFISLLEYHPICTFGTAWQSPTNRKNQIVSRISLFQYLSLIKRGFFFGLFTDGFKVGS